MLLVDLYEGLGDHKWDMVRSTAMILGVSEDTAKKIVAVIQDNHPEFWNIVDVLDREDPQELTAMFRTAMDNMKAPVEEGVAWARSGNKVVKKFRCTGGPRSGRVVGKPAQCFAAPDIKKRIKLKQTKAKLGKKMVRKRKKTLRTNPASKRVQALNRKN